MTVSDQHTDGPPAPLHHVGFVVEDLERAAGHFGRTYRVGPFLVVALVAFEERFDNAVAKAARGWDGQNVLQALDSISVG